MKFLLLMPNSLVGGAETVAFSLASTMLEAGHSVTVCILSRGEGTFWPQLSNHDRFSLIASDAASEKTGLIDLVRNLPRIARRGPYDLVYSSHVHMNATASLMMRLGLIRGQFLVSRESTRVFDRFSGLKLAMFRLAYRFYGRQDLLICQTEEMRDSLLANMKLPSSVQVIVLPNPVNRSRIDRALAGSDAASPPAETFSIVFAGRLMPLKRVSMILDALGKLKDRHWSFTVLGRGELRDDLERQARSLGIADRVTFAGQVDNPFRYFRAADLGILTSEIEGFPNVVLEMMASGVRHVIATPCTGAVRQLEGVEILEDQTADGLARAIARAIDNRSDSSRGYSEFVDRHHSAEGYAQAILQRLDPALKL